MKIAVLLVQRPNDPRPVEHRLIGKTSFEIGGARGKDLDIALESITVAARQVSLRRDEVGWWIRAYPGRAPVIVNGASLAPGSSQLIEIGAEIRIAEFSLRLTEREVGADADHARDGDLDREDAQFLAMLTRRSHDALLERMKDMQGIAKAETSRVQGRFTEEERQQLSRAIEEIAEAAAHGLALGADLEKAVSGAVHRRCAELIVEAGLQGGGRASTDLDHQSNLLLGEIGVRRAPRSLSHDLDLFKERFDEKFSARRRAIDERRKRRIVQDMLARSVEQIAFELGPIQSLNDMDSVSEIMVVCPDIIYVEKDGGVSRLPYAFASEESLLLVIERIVQEAGRAINQARPMVDARLPNGSRVNAVIKPLALRGPNLTIRKFPSSPRTLAWLQQQGAMSPPMRVFLESCVKARKNVVVSGGTSSGKTTMLNALSAFVASTERVITIEDTAELQLLQDHVITLQSRVSGQERTGAVTIQDLVRNALRMRPDRIIVGECRGAETLDMLQAMNTGHDGSMTTAHANSPDEMMLRLEAMVQMGYSDMPSSAIRRQIGAAVDLVVQVAKVVVARPVDGPPQIARRVTHVAEIVGVDDETGQLVSEDVFRHRLFKQPDGSLSERFYFTGYLPECIDELIRDGGFEWEKFSEQSGAALAAQ